MGFTVRESIDSFAHGSQRIAVEHYQPVGPERYPAVLLLHGRDGMAFAGERYRWLGREVAGHGFAVFLVHYFGGPRPARETTDPTQFLGWIECIGEAISYVGAQPGVAGQCAGLIGVSLGGYLAVGVAAQDRRVQAVVECFGGLPEPMARQLGHMPPVLILHGSADEVVPVREAERLAGLLEQQGRPCELVVYPGEGHILGPAASLDAAFRTVTFLQRHMAGQGPAHRVLVPRDR